ncbi:hypothetical protein ACFQ1E_07690 [Sphingomonas canadensis]|uniref:Uncharacterized protein n=1 Tax=Sphingomonas canadensis TaxID=1219257 RepID=A0ABW3H4Y2_9SPHN|nr:hypothetical protein [Sphingomonas canadensis]MCW3835917.1 hypothetical protein [Sphingomonas canadensis]
MRLTPTNASHDQNGTRRPPQRPKPRRAAPRLREEEPDLLEIIFIPEPRRRDS